MEFTADPDAAEFAANALPLLRRDPVANNVVTSLALAHAQGQLPADPANRWLRITDAGELVGVAAWIPPRGPVLSAMEPDAAAALADHLSTADVGTVAGPAASSDAFARRYAVQTGARPEIGLDLVVYRLGELRLPTGVPGGLREAGPRDRELLIDWLYRLLRAGRERGGGGDAAEPRLHAAGASRQGLRSGRRRR
jgi:hypothetical protein